MGRFGWKAQEPTLLSFSADAYLNEMGVTTRVAHFDKDIAPDGNQMNLRPLAKRPVTV